MNHRWIWAAAVVLILGIGASLTMIYTTMFHSESLETLDVSGLTRIGRGDAPNEIVIISDYACPACRKMHSEVMPGLLREYVDSGRARLSLVVFPVKQGSTELARIVHCVGTDLGRDWRGLIDRAYSPALHGLDERRIAATLLDLPADDAQVDRTLACAKRQDVIERIERARYEVLARGINSVPQLLVNRTRVNDPWNAAEVASAFSTSTAMPVPQTAR
jgi:protein-disulfide isomerase